MCDLVKSASPVSVLGSQLEQLTPEHRGLLKQLLRLFGLVRVCVCTCACVRACMCVRACVCVCVCFCELLKSYALPCTLPPSSYLPNHLPFLPLPLFSSLQQVINHSHKNHTEVSELNRMFGPLLFDRLPSAQSEPLMAYLISTCELILT